MQISCDLIRGKDVSAAAAILMNSPKAASEPLFEAFAFGTMANAGINNHEMNPEKLYVAQVFACPGPFSQAGDAPCAGRAFRINKKDLACSPWSLAREE